MKIMKNKTKIISTVLLIISLSTYAKSQSGIYKSASDFKNDKLTNQNTCSGRKKIHTHDFFWSMPTVKVEENGKKYTYLKSELYGYKNCKNEVYRFYNNTEYQIAEAGNIYVYVQQKNITQSKGFIVVNAYYFSTTPDGEIMPLTADNLKKAFRTNDKFLGLIEQHINAENVPEYDQVHTTFKINYLYSKSINKQ